MGSTLRSDVSKALLFERLLRSWEKRPDLTLARLVVDAIGGSERGLLDPRGKALADRLEYLAQMTDRELAEAVERFVLMT